jgi:hypothetical protein
VVRAPAWTTLTLGVCAASLVMCVLFWPDARIGLYLNVSVFLVVLLI